MAGEFRITRADEIPSDVDVRHFDQLDETAQRRLADAVRDRDLPATVTAGRELFDGDEFVKFTDYYRVECRSAGDSLPGSVASD